MFYAVFIICFIAQGVNIGQDVYHHYYKKDCHSCKAYNWPRNK